ncbi:hypothetical protein [Streptosporangium carneum]|uniref:Lipoprotein n=1 Tax=Streptosporangium carneum TaxID=47481 RepID=A0A9W6MB82_9ACTN|nr:hypothetical protein [Streptosporangium carneum]GLK07871.1 hypothetical protein GCM10017600_12760 [Streptosporangium carneum]
MRVLPVAATVGLVLSLAGCSTIPLSFPYGVRAPTPPPSTAPPSVTPTPTETETETETETSRAAVGHYRGSGDRLIPIKPTTAAGLITVVARGRGSFMVQSVDASGDDVEFLAEGENGYRGTRMYNLGDEEPVAALRVTARGSWKITLKSVQEARVWSGPTVRGFGDDVLYLEPEAEGGETITSAFTGDEHFAVEGYTEEDSSLLANEVDPGEVEEELPDGTFLVTVEGDVPWKLRRSGPHRIQRATGPRPREDLVPL